MKNYLLFRRASSPSPWNSLEPVREELFSLERLEEHARSLAVAQKITPKLIRGNTVTNRLADNGSVIFSAYRGMIEAVDGGYAITPAAEWLIDNYPLVEKQIREVRLDLPPGYYRQLPKLAAGPFAGYPRVFGMAWAFVAHTDSHFDSEMLQRYVKAYQEIEPLTIGELWAISLTLRLVLIENLRRLAEQIVSNRADRKSADALADRLLGLGGHLAEPVEAIMAANDRKPIHDAFAVQLVHRLRDQDPRITPALIWLEQRLAVQGTTADMVVRDVHKDQGASNITMRNIITSLRLIGDVDWSEAFEGVSLVDDALGADSKFNEMDFPTRNLYRSAIEELARGSKQTELEIAHLAILAAKTVQDPAIPRLQAPLQERRCDPGYYLIAGGRRGFEKTIGFRQPLHDWPKRLNWSLGIAGYALVIAVVIAILLAVPLLMLTGARCCGYIYPLLLAALGIIPAFDAAISLVNRAAMARFGATILPALELKEGIPEELRTLVAVPTLLTTAEEITRQIERLEVHYLASCKGELYFALLSDWTDCLSEHRADDEALLAVAAEGIAGLNRRYGPTPQGNRFLLLHRRRVWNQGEARWLGWERKRGKIHELNRLLRDATDTTFIEIGGVQPSVPAKIRYVITLDADTRLPRDTVRRLIGKMSHALNRPRFDMSLGRVVEGYAVLQPRVTPSMPVGREGSLFQRIFSSTSGIDPYASANSDVYQDLFGEGSYTGKGIYDVDAFEAALAGRVPDSTLLSHDLFEGVFARAGFASDIEVVEEYPARYDVGALRHHRWARGDWQLLPWILGSTLPALGRWKMLDNLRRTLSAPLSVMALIAGWILPFDAALVWTVFILSTIILPTLLPVSAVVFKRRPEITTASHMRGLVADLHIALTLSLLLVTFLAHQAWLMGDAILRTLWRLFSRRHLLEWVPAAQAAIGPKLNLFGFYRFMAGAVIIAATALIVPYSLGHRGWILAAPFAALWLASPAVARSASLSPRNGPLPMSPEDVTVLRQSARQTWRFFETFVTEVDNMLPPDNFQEDPLPAVAHRTSPTNLGLYLLSIAAARDFGWIGTADAIERLEATLATMNGLTRFRGHFYNWYDTRDLRPLEPRYISSVDSGNLAGHLIALANACREWSAFSLDTNRRLAGIGDAIDLARAETIGLHDGRKTQTVTWSQLDGALARLSSDVRRPPAENEDIPRLFAQLARQSEILWDMAHALAAERGNGSGSDMLFWTEAVLRSIEGHQRDFKAFDSLRPRLLALEESIRAMAMAMEFGFLLDPKRKLLSIGYLISEGTLDANCYDLLASEARLASFIAIAKGDVPARHWFRLGRALTPVAHSAALISWSGSMFEYLMPSLIMRTPEQSLLGRTNRLVVRRQIDYATHLNLPWGVSESAYNARDLELTYQYSNFGVPGLGLKRGLGKNLVVAPYATALAAMIDPRAASANLARLAGVSARGRYGFYEALDYTPLRLRTGAKVAIVRAYMAHHQGMSIVAIADALLDGVMQTRFHAEPIIQATELLLQERMPREVPVVRPWTAEINWAARIRHIEEPLGRRFASPHQETPATQLLTNGRYVTMLTTAESGYSRWGDIAITRWREDATCDDAGSYIFLRDVRNGEVWSAGFQPRGIEPDEYSVIFNEDRAEFTRHDKTLVTRLEVLVSSENDAEVRRVSISNTGVRTRECEITSYAELALAPQAADMAHPAFSKLFVETEYLADIGAIIAARRKREPKEPEIWAAHLAVVDGEAVGKPEIETDRARFLGRRHSARNPIAVIDGRPLSGTVGTVLDPIFALRRRVRIAPGATVSIAFWTIAAATREALLAGIDKHRDTTAFSRAATLAWTQAQVELHHFGITPAKAGLFQRLAGHVIYATPTLRSSSNMIHLGSGPQSGLWAHGISGDLPIVLLRISDTETLDVARELLQAHEYWRMKGLAVDLVILNERQSSYIQDLQVALETLVRISQSRRQAGQIGQLGQVTVLRADLIPPETSALLASVARIVLVAQRGSLFDQLNRIDEAKGTARQFAKHVSLGGERPAAPPTPELEFFNGLGGFAEDAKEYVTILGPGQSTPAPWINVISNSDFGFHVATEGGGYTWSRNSRENQLTPWSNDPVTDRPGEAIYLRDEETGEVWSPTAGPIRDETATYIARHGRGYSRFEHTRHAIAANLIQYVPLDAPIKISRLTLNNQSNRTRTISVTAYVEWLLGPPGSSSRSCIATEIDSQTGALFARNPWSLSFGSRVAFIDLRGTQTEWTGDRRAFIGRNGTLANPAALETPQPLSKKIGAGLDACGALRSKVRLPPHGKIEIVFCLGQGANEDEARTLITHYRTADLDAVEATIARYWDDVLGKIQVKTPDRSMDIMLNGWLLYQTLACRFWARAAFYQVSGAYGFRDQLQDGMALAVTRPDLTREHILRAAARQFVEGDVQHWWLPHSGQGVRTKISDDRAWLAYTVSHYIEVTGDSGVLDEMIPFLEATPLKEDEHDRFFRPGTADKSASLFEHCALALDQSLTPGSHGLPLMGTGDWNDGMNRVGEKGKGESVWLGWFLYSALAAFTGLAVVRHDAVRAKKWQAHMTLLRASLEREAWDGDWYRRGFFDDGTPLGSAASDECRIDSIAQSWAVLSGAATPERATSAMAALERELINRGDGLALLFAPPFDKTGRDPGYIKGYPPGIRENGGQYTHAALWSVMAFAALGEGDKAAGLFSLLNPVNHARSRADVLRYKVEPYVVAADVYSRAPHVGRGGWTWYTGSAGWMYRAGIESILGLRLQGDTLCLEPCTPKAWPGFELSFRHGSTLYTVSVDNSAGAGRGIAFAALNGDPIAERPLRLKLTDDGGQHRLDVRLGAREL